MFEMVIQSSLLIAALIALRPLLKRWLNARALYALWLLPALRMLLPFSVRSAWSVLNAVQPAVARVEAAARTPVFPAMAPAAHVGGETMVNASVPMPTAPSAAGMAVGDVLLGIWLAVALLLMGYMVAVNVRIRRRMLKKVHLVGESRGLPVYLAKGIHSPCLLGALKPRILMPLRTLQNPPVRDMALRHEVAHYRRRDNWWALMRNALLCLYWFNPLVWIAAKLCREDCEMACDEAVLAGLHAEARELYGMALIRMLCDHPMRRAEVFLSGTTMMSESGRQMKDRIKRIAANKRARLGLSAAAALVLTLAVLVTCSSAEPVRQLSDQPVASRLPEVPEVRGTAGAPVKAAQKPADDAQQAARQPADSSQSGDPSALAADVMRRYEAQLPWVTFSDAAPTALRDQTLLGAVLGSYAFYGRASSDGEYNYILGILTAAESPLYEAQEDWNAEANPSYVDADGNPVDPDVVPGYIGVYGSGKVIFVITDHELEAARYSAPELKYAVIQQDWAYIEDCTARGTYLSPPPVPYLLVRSYSENRTEFIRLTEADMARAQSDARLYQPEEYGSCGLAVVTQAGEEPYDEPVAESLVQLAEERFGYAIVKPEDIAPLRAASMYVELFDEKTPVQQITDAALLKELERMLKTAKPVSPSKCPFTGYVTLTFADGTSLEVFKATDSCQTLIMGSSGSYEISRSDNERFWEIFNEVAASMNAAHETARLASQESMFAPGDVLLVANCEAFVSLRERPSASAERLTTLPLGAVVSCVGVAGDGFWQVRYGDHVGYILSDYLYRVDAGNPAAGYVVRCKEYVTLRSYPDSDAPQLNTIPLGAEVSCFDISEGAFSLVHYNGEYGYVLAEYLSDKP